MSQVCVGDIQEAKGKEFVAVQQKIHGEEKIIFSCCDVTQEADYTSEEIYILKLIKTN